MGGGCSLVILAGGLSRRMGRDKAALPAGGVTHAARRQGSLVATHAAAEAAGKDHEAAAAAHGMSLRAEAYCPMAPLMLQKTLATWLPRTISTTITTTAIRTRINAYSTIDWPRSSSIKLASVRRMSSARCTKALSVQDLSLFVTGPSHPRHARKDRQRPVFPFNAGSESRGRWRVMRRPRSTGR